MASRFRVGFFGVGFSFFNAALKFIKDWHGEAGEKSILRLLASWLLSVRNIYLFLSCFVPTGLPKVRFLCGITQVIKMEKWVFKGPSGVHLSRQQLPLKLAWAISIHKSQVGVLIQLSVDVYTIIRLISCVSLYCW